VFGGDAERYLSACAGRARRPAGHAAGRGTPCSAGRRTLPFRLRRPHERPFLRLCAKTRPHRIIPDIARFFLVFASVADPMVEKVLLPSNTSRPRKISFPLPHSLSHRPNTFVERHKRVQMIGHQKQQARMPNPFALVMFHRLADAPGNRIPRQRVHPARTGVDAQKKHVPVRNPRRYGMGQALPMEFRHGLKNVAGDASERNRVSPAGAFSDRARRPRRARRRPRTPCSAGRRTPPFPRAHADARPIR